MILFIGAKDMTSHSIKHHKDSTLLRLVTYLLPKIESPIVDKLKVSKFFLNFKTLIGGR